MKKRIFCFLIVLAIVCTSTFFTVTAVSETENLNKQDEAIEVLKALNIIRAYQEEGYKPKLNLTRGEAAFMVANFINAPMDAYQEQYIAEDGSVNWIQCATDYMISAGIFTESEPDKLIRPIDFIRILVSVMGGDMMAESLGGYPYGYIEAAQRINILPSNMSLSDESITKGEAAQILKEALDEELWTMDMSDGGAIPSDDTPLSLYHNIYHTYGRLTGNELTELTGESLLRKGMVRIDNRAYEVSGKDCTDMIGLEVEFYYKRDSIDCILYVAPANGKNKTITIHSDDLVSYENMTYTYVKNDKNTKSSISPDADIIYNNKAVLGLEDSCYVPNNGYVELIDTDNNGSMNLVRIYAYTTVVADRYIAGENNLYSKMGGAAIDLSGEVRIYEDQKLIEKETIAENDIMMLMVSYDEECVIGYLTKKAVSGQLNRVSVKDGKKVLRISGVNYQVNNDYLMHSSYSEMLGMQGKFYLDMNNEIAWYEGGVITGSELAYLMGMRADRTWGNNVQIQLMKKNGDIVIMSVADNVKVDGRKCENETEIRACLPGELRSVILYTTNGDGEIDKIDTPLLNDEKESKETSLQPILTNGASTMKYKSNRMIFGLKVAINDNTIIFSVPKTGDLSDKELYKVLNRTLLVNDSTHTVEGFRVGDGHGCADVLVMHDGESVLETLITNSHVSMIEKIENVLDDKTGETYAEVTLKGEKTGTFNLTLDEETELYHAGDIIVFNLFGSEIKGAKRIYDGVNKTYNMSALPGGISVIKGWVYYTDSPYVTISDTLADESRLTEDNFYLCKTDSAPSFMYGDTRELSVEKRDAASFKDYKSFGANCTKVLAIRKYDDIYALFEVE